MGYRVIDEYVRQGQEFAQRAWSPLGSMEALGADPQKLTERMFQSASDLAAGWLQYMQSVMPGAMSGPSTSPAAPARPAAPIGGFDIGAGRSDSGSSESTASHRNVPETESASSPTTSIEIASSRRVEVSVDLKPGSARLKLSAFDLRATDPALPRISGVGVDCHSLENRVVVRLKIPPEQPPGTYSGLVVDDELNLPRGTLSVRVFD